MVLCLYCVYITGYSGHVRFGINALQYNTICQINFASPGPDRICAASGNVSPLGTPGLFIPRIHGLFHF